MYHIVGSSMVCGILLGGHTRTLRYSRVHLKEISGQHQSVFFLFRFCASPNLDVSINTYQ